MGSGPTEVELAVRLVLAVALGTLVGLERESRHKIAGVRTHALVSLGAALFAIAGAFGVEDRDATRLAAQVVSGIGFIGAGVSRASGICPVADSRTARSWPTELPGGGQVFCPWVSWSVASPPCRRWRFQIQLSYATGAGTLAPLFEVVTAAGGHVGRMVMEEEDGTRHVTCAVRGVTSEAIDAIVERLAERPEVIAISDNFRQ